MMDDAADGTLDVHRIFSQLEVLSLRGDQLAQQADALSVQQKQIAEEQRRLVLQQRCLFAILNGKDGEVRRTIAEDQGSSSGPWPAVRTEDISLDIQYTGVPVEPRPQAPSVGAKQTRSKTTAESQSGQDLDVHADCMPGSTNSSTREGVNDETPIMELSTRHLEAIRRLTVACAITDGTATDSDIMLACFKEWSRVRRELLMKSAVHNARMPPGIVHPMGKTRTTLDILSAFFIPYDLVMIPILLAWAGTGVDESDFFGWLSLCFWTIDSFVGFNSAYYQRGGELVTDRRKIVRRYFLSWFPIDVLTVGMEWGVIVGGIFATGKISRGQSNEQSIDLGFLRALRAFRLIRLLKLIKLMEGIYDRIDSEFMNLLCDVLKLLLFVFAFAHVCGCVFFAVSITVQQQGYASMTWIEHESLLDYSWTYQYSTALHWAITQVSPGSMEIFPRNTYERQANLCILFVGLVLFAFFISQLTAALTRLKNLAYENDKQMSALKTYLRDNKTPRSLAVRIRRYVEYILTEQAKIKQEGEVPVLKLLTRGLTMELRQSKVEPHLITWNIFRIMSMEDDLELFQSVCVTACETSIQAPSDVVFMKGRNSVGMYFLLQGAFNYVFGMQSVTLEPKPDAIEYMCELAIISKGWIHRGALRSERYSQVLCVKSDLLEKCMHDYPHTSARMRGRFSEELTDLAKKYHGVPLDGDWTRPVVDSARTSGLDEIHDWLGYNPNVHTSRGLQHFGFRFSNVPHFSSTDKLRTGPLHKGTSIRQATPS